MNSLMNSLWLNTTTIPIKYLRWKIYIVIQEIYSPHYAYVSNNLTALSD